MPIYEERLQKDLNRLRDEAADLGKHVEIAVRNAVKALLTNDDALANTTVIGDEWIDRQMRDIDKSCHSLIIRHMPSAKHLRFVTTVQRMVGDLERIGDYAVNISRESLHLRKRPEGIIQRDLETLADHAIAVLHQAIQSFVLDDVSIARSTMEMTEPLVREVNHAYEDLLNAGSSLSVPDLLDFHSIFYMLQRIKSRAKNICEETLFVVSGDIRPEQQWKVLFIDNDNIRLSQMAEAIARKNYAASGQFASAGRQPGTDLSPGVVDFMGRYGFDLKGAKPKGVADCGVSVDLFHVIVNLEGSIRSSECKIPFQTAFFDWDLKVPPSSANLDEATFKSLYRDLSVRIQHLMDVLRGEEAV